MNIGLDPRIIKVSIKLSQSFNQQVCLSVYLFYESLNFTGLLFCRNVENLREFYSLMVISFNG